VNIIYDVFPARVRVSPPRDDDDIYKFDELTVMTRLPASRLVTAVRLVLTKDRVMIAGDSSSGPMLIFQEKYDPETLHLVKKGSESSRFKTLSGKIVIFDKDSNCGCGSRLRSWNPYRTLGSINDPTS